MSMSVELTAGPRSFPRRAILMVAALGVLVAGCGADPGEDADDPATSPHALRADYQQNWGEIGRVHLEVTTSGPDEVRVRWTTPEDDPPSEIVWVYDGKQLLEYGNDPEGYTLYKDPEQSEGFELVRAFVLLPGSDSLADACPEPERIGTKAISGRTAIGYRCSPGKKLDALGKEIWVDETTGLVLDAPRLGLIRLDPEEPIDDTTFSTVPPEGAEVIGD
jgi:outer membrane lipoprotein-sorting protein